MKNVQQIVEDFKSAPGSKRFKTLFCEKLDSFYKDPKDLLDSYIVFLTQREKEKDQTALTTRARNNLNKWRNPEIGITRSSIIDLAFLLADNSKKNGEDVANELLKAMGYPLLHSRSEIETLYGYCLRNGLSYLDCQMLYQEYIKYSTEQTSAPNDSMKILPISDDADEKTSSYYSREQSKLRDKTALFSHLAAESIHFGTGSRRLSKLVTDQFNKMLPEASRSRTLLCLDFYLYYASDKSVQTFLTEFKAAGYGAIESVRAAYNQHINCRSEFCFYPMASCSYSAVYDSLTNVMNGRGFLTREGLLLWLLFYYHKDNEGNEDFFDLTKVNELLHARYLLLDDRFYFDRYIMTILNFSLENGSVKFGNEMIADDPTLNKENIHTLRRSVIRLFRDAFDKTHVAAFGGTSNSTSSLEYASTRKRFEED